MGWMMAWGVLVVGGASWTVVDRGCFGSPALVEVAMGVIMGVVSNMTSLEMAARLSRCAEGMEPEGIACRDPHGTGVGIGTRRRFHWPSSTQHLLRVFVVGHGFCWKRLCSITTVAGRVISRLSGLYRAAWDRFLLRAFATQAQHPQGRP